MSSKSLKDAVQESINFDKYLLRSNHVKKLPLALRMIAYYLVGILMRLRPRAEVIVKEPCDILFLYISDIHKKRAEGVSLYLRERNYNSIGLVIPRLKEIFLNRFYLDPARVPFQYALFLGFARYIDEKYSPKMIVTFSENSKFTPFLKHCLSDKRYLINIAHAIPDLRHKMLNFDYFILFGRSSLEKFYGKEDQVFGNPKLILAGSFLLKNSDKKFSLQPHLEKGFLFSSFFLTPLDKFNAFYMFDSLCEWARLNPHRKIFIKLHPLENHSYWHDRSNEFKNIIVIPKSLEINEILEEYNISLLITSHSNLSIELAAMGIPSVVFNPEYVDDSYLRLESFFGARCKNLQELSQRIEDVESKYADYVVKAEKYAKYHLEYNTGTLARIERYLGEILQEKPLSGEVFTIADLKRSEKLALPLAEHLLTEETLAAF